ncbi:hypothetical protein DL96DRAFT_1454924 [Flagelloscypha sp. PMI_526]|nr:hypothetical protein DL96DRAFT_1454924 [Flagelloscypha sp. PMI_526]
MNALQLAYGDSAYTSYPSTTSNVSSHVPTRPLTPPDGMGISPQMASYQLVSGVAPDMSPSMSSRASPTPPPTSMSADSKVPRSHRFNPMVPAAKRPAARAQRRRRMTEEEDDEEDDDDFRPGSGSFSSAGEERKEVVRKQRIESEQKRRDDLRDGYQRLKEILPASSQKSSKVVLLERATNQIKYLDTVKGQLERRLQETEDEMRRLRRVNDALMESRALQPQMSAMATF